MSMFLAALVAHGAQQGLRWSPSTEATAPMSLTAADGTGLKLTDMRVQAVVDGPLAFTELHLTFVNPEPRQIEGRFEITLPDGAAVSRFAMKLDDRWQEGEVVELKAARRAYEDFLHRRTDPALLEYEAGNEFRARVFPIAPNGTKELIISWSHDLDVDEPWMLPTGGLPELGHLTAEVTSGGRTHRMQTEYAVPEGDLAFLPEVADAVALRGANTTVARFQPQLQVAQDPVKDAVVLVDTSASRALAWDGLLADLAHVLPTFGGQLTVIAYDQEAAAIWKGRAKDFGSAGLKQLGARGAFGASDLSAALEGLDAADRLVLFTDGVLTAGDDQPALVEALGRFGRVDAVLRGGARDQAALAELAGAGKRQGAVLDADALGAPAVAERLALGTADTLTVEVPGASWVYPSTVDGLQPGDTLTVYADLPLERPLDLRVQGARVPKLTTQESSGPLLVRASAQAEIAALQVDERRAVDAKAREATIARIVEVSTSQRVLSPHTALLVLETEADYARFDIPRDALTDILQVRDGKLAWIERTTAVLGAGEGVEAPENDARVDDTVEKEAPLAKKSELRDAFDDEAPMMEASEAPPAPPPPPPEAARREAEAARRPSPRPVQEEERRSRRQDERARERMVEAEEAADEGRKASTDPLDAWEGEFREVKALLLGGRAAEALTMAKAWQQRAPGEPLALIALAEAYEATGDRAAAARAYGSLIDLFPSRADLRRLAGERLAAISTPLAVDTFRRAVQQRPDHPSGHRLLAWALVRQQQHAEAIEVLKTALEQPFQRFEAAHRILREDAALIGAAWAVHDRRAAEEALGAMGLEPATTPSMRFVLNWETDANDVDFHIFDARGGHAYYSDHQLRSGGELYADITSGYGPECFAIDRPDAFPYRMQAHYYSRGPMGFGMGQLSVVQHDGKGRLSFEDRPFVVMTDGAYVDLGGVEKSAY